MFQELVIKAKMGDMDAKEEIIEKLQPLIISSINKYNYEKISFEDLIQDGNLEILEAIDHYDMDSGVYFLGYIKMRLRFLYLNMNEDTQVFSLNEKVFDEGNQEKIDLIEDESVDILKSIIMQEGETHLYMAYEELSSREKEIINYYYIRRYNMKEISKKLNLAYRTVVNTKVNAINKLRRNLDYKDIN